MACVLLLASGAQAQAPSPAVPPAEPLTLLSAYLHTADHSPAARAANAAYAAARLAKPAAASRLLPEIGVSARYDRIRQGIEGDYFGLSDLNTATIHTRPSVSLRFEQPLFQRELFVRLDQASAVTQRAELQLTLARQDLLLQVARAYFDLLASQEAGAAADAEQQAVDQQLQQVRVKVESGLTADYELKATRAQADFSRANAIQAANERALALNRLERLMGQPATRLRELPADALLPATDSDEPDTWVERSLARNLGLAIQALNTRIAELEVDREDAGHWPSLSLVGTHLYYDADGGFTGAREYSDSRIGAVLNLPLFDGFATSTRVEAAGFRLLEARELESALRQDVSEATRATFLSLQSTRLRAEALGLALTSAQSALDAVRVGFDVGTRTSADVLDAIRNHSRARRDLQTVRYQYLLNWLQLKRQAGSLTPADFENLDLLFKPKR